MQKMQQPDFVTPEQLVCEILRLNHHYGKCSSSSTRNDPESEDQSVRMYSGEDDDLIQCEDEGVSSNNISCSNNKQSSHLHHQSEIIMLDCQNPGEFHEAHIRGAVNVTFPAIMVRRIQTGKIDLFDKSKELKEKMANSNITFVVYDAFSNSCSAQESSRSGVELSEIVSLVAKKLAQNGCSVFTLRGT